MKKKRAVLLIVLALVCFMLTSCLAIEDAKTHQRTVDELLSCDFQGMEIRDLRYAEGDYHLYDLYLPKDTMAAEASHLVVFIHGGGWTSGYKEDGQLWCRYLASKGYTTASVEYTLQDKTHSTNVHKINDEIHVAVQAIANECLSRGLVLSDMATMGFSAGACQALLYGLKDPDSSVLPVRFVIDQSGPTTFDPEIWMKGNVHKTVTKVTHVDGSPEGSAYWVSLTSGEAVTAQMIEDGSANAIWQNASPACHVSASSVPVLLAYGALDGVVPPKSRNVLEDALETAGVSYYSILMEHSGHGLTFDLGKARELVAKAEEFCLLYF